MENNINNNEGKKNEEKIVFAKRPWTVFLIFNFVLACFLGSLFGFFASEIREGLGVLWNEKVKETVPAEMVTERIIQEDSAVIQVVDDTSPAVVSVVITKEASQIQGQYSPFESDFFNYFFGYPNPNERNESENKEERTVGKGSGFLVSSDGMIVTNKHVVEDSTASYFVFTHEGEKHEAKILAKDPLNDIAILKIEGENYPTLALGDSTQVKIGQTVIAIGNSLGEFSNTVSRGIVSGLGRSITAGNEYGQAEVLADIIQTDAAINSGNSGGPLLNIKGEVIGINVAMAQGAENVGFAIPVNQIKRAVEQVKVSGKISVPYLGVRYIAIDKSIQRANNLPQDYGVLVVRGQRVSDLAVIPGSPAEKAGLQENDIILEIEGEKITEKTPLTNLIAKYNIGQEVTLKIWRKGNEEEVRVTLEERQNN